MRFDLSSQNTKILQEQKKHRQWMVAFLVLSVTVVLGTAAALKLYGQALTHKVKVLDCQVKAHEHTDECYVYDEKKGEDVPVCGYADYLVHVHNDDCYDENGRLVCPLEEIKPHKHTDECYEERRVLVCGLEGIEPAQGADTDAAGTAGSQPGQTPGGGTESQPVKTTEAENQPEQTSGAQSQPTQEATTEAPPTEAPTTEAPTTAASAKAPAETESKLVCVEKEHTHTDACYGEAALSCGLEEHKHGDDCYETTLACDAPEHAHESSCYDENGELVCGFEEHEHGDACYEKTLTCMKEEHEHEDACYGERELTCKEKEHTHTDACYAEVAVETTAPAETKAPETKAPETNAPETNAPETNAAETTAAPTTAAPETATAAGEGVHVHTDACYETKLVPVCGKLELHTHDEDCYDEDGRLICELPQLEEHVHDKDCFKTVELTDEEIAALNAGVKLHIHHEDCYDENGKLICGHNETHIHGEKCYDRDGKLICGHDEDHVHTPDCYDKNGDIICGLEVVVHEHTDACYDENGKLICDHAHIHEESCFDEDGNMTCDFEDVGDYLWTCENEEENYIVTAKFNYEAKIPGNAKLIAEQIKSEGDDGEYFAQREKEYREAMQDETADMRALMRIGFYVENKDAKNEKDKLIEIEPEAPVTITVQFLDDDGLADGEPITVVHFGKEGTELLDGGQAEDNSTTFEMKGFSDIAIGYGDEGAKASVSGNEIDEDDENVIDKEKKIHLDDSFEYEDEAFHITFHVKGDAVLPEDAVNKEEKKESISDTVSSDTSSDEEVTGPEGKEAEEEAKTDTETEEKPEETSKEETSESAEDTSEAETSGAVEDEEASSAAEESGEEETTAAGRKAAGQRMAAAVNGEDNAEETFGETESGAEETTEGKEPEVEASASVAETTEEEESKEDISEGSESEITSEGKTEIVSDNGKLAFTVENVEQNSAEYAAFAAYAKENEDSSEKFLLQVMSYSLTYEDAKLDLSDCKVTAEIVPTQALNEFAAGERAEMKSFDMSSVEASEQTSREIMVDALQLTADMQVDQAGTMVIGEPEVIAYAENADEDTAATSEPQAAEPAVITFEMTSEYFAARATGQPNPEFTVQYYATLDKVAYNDDLLKVTTSGANTNELPVIDTTGGKLPVNGKGKDVSPNANNIRMLYVDTATGKLKTKSELTEVYAARPFKYLKAPTINYINAVIENPSYELKEVWVLKKDRQPDSINRGDWDIYPYKSGELHFTNRKLSNGDGYIYLEDGTTLRLVYDTKKNNRDIDAAFYDYDIGDGYIYQSAQDAKNQTNKRNTSSQGTGTWYMHTEESGINDPQNYSGTGSKLAFGNSNTGSGLQYQSWGENLLNKFNGTQDNQPPVSGSYKGCTFGLASGLKNGKIQYAKNVIAPNLFNDGTAIGKTSYNYSLKFDRNGDTHTLIAVNGTNTNNLDSFKNPDSHNWKGEATTHYHIWTNSFWPMDSVTSYGTNEHDMKFGNYANRAKYNYAGKAGDPSGKYAGAGANGQFPWSDDDIDHNSYFGMNYTVEFELVADYTGPLEYYFFGDDDMWVFLGDENGQNGKLVCDIGGVHSSVGEYLNLWDYIDKEKEKIHRHTDECYANGEQNPPTCGYVDKKTFTLSFFYTERGESGSTCWMQFTLPSVSSKTPETTDKDYGHLEIRKDVKVVVDNQEYSPSDLFAGKEQETNFNDKEFEFILTLKGPDGDLRDDYAYTKYDKEGKPISSDQAGGSGVLQWETIANGETFTLKDGEYIRIQYLPKGSQYTIKEFNGETIEGITHETTEVSGVLYSGTAITGDPGDNIDYINLKIEGIIPSDATKKAAYTNKYSVFALPKTGGPGTNLYTMAGALCVICSMFGAGLMYRKKYRGRRV